MILDQLEYSWPLALSGLCRWRLPAQLNDAQTITEVIDHLTGEIQQIALG